MSATFRHGRDCPEASGMLVVYETDAGPPACTCGIGALLAVAKAADPESGDEDQVGRVTAAVSEAVEHLTAAHPGWREWA